MKYSANRGRTGGRWTRHSLGVAALAFCVHGHAMAAPAGKPTIEPALPVAPQGIPGRSASVSDQGAIPDDGVDDTLAIQNTIDVIAGQGGGHVLFPPGRYDVSIQPTSAQRPRLQALIMRSKTRLAASDPRQGATIRLADRQGNYESLLATADYPQALDDFVLEGLTIDSNGPNNPVLDPTVDFGNGQAMRYALRVFVGARIRVDRCRFINQANVNVITLNGEDVSDGDIRNSRFEGIGNAAVDYDHSTIYTNGPRMRVADSRFSSLDGPGTKGARTAIEIHGLDQTITGNTVSGFTYGVNIVGDGPSGGQRQLYLNNRISGVSTGFVIWSLLDGRSTNERSLAEVEIRANTVKIDLDDWQAAALDFDVTSGAGIALQSANDAPVDKLIIADNEIRFVKARGGPSSYAEQRSAAIVFDLFAHPDRAVRGLAIDRNRIENPVGPGIFIATPIEGGPGSVISRNTIVNPARGRELRYPEAMDFRSGIYIADPGAAEVQEGRSARSVVQDVRVKRNTVQVVSETDPPLAYGANAVSSCAGRCVLSETVVTGSAAQPQQGGPGWKLR
jgi:Pectate lyase superfamily protein